MHSIPDDANTGGSSAEKHDATSEIGHFFDFANVFGQYLRHPQLYCYETEWYTA